jgi:D-alanine--poly(phosphoribitol) ligase subunit 2
VSAEIERGVREVFRDVLMLELASADVDLIDTGLLDSLGLVEVLFELEQRFGVELSLEDLDIDSFRTTKRIAALIEHHGGVPYDASAR